MKKTSIPGIILLSIFILTAAGCNTFKKPAEEGTESVTLEEAENQTVAPEEITEEKKDEEVTTQKPKTTTPPPAPKTEAPKPVVKNFNIVARQFEFQPDTITVNEGDTVRLSVNSQDVTHGIIIPDFGVNKTIPAGSTITAEFVANKKGTFQFRCSVYCGQGHSGMTGTLVVK